MPTGPRLRRACRLTGQSSVWEIAAAFKGMDENYTELQKAYHSLTNPNCGLSLPTTPLPGGNRSADCAQPGPHHQRKGGQTVSIPGKEGRSRVKFYLDEDISARVARSCASVESTPSARTISEKRRSDEDQIRRSCFPEGCHRHAKQGRIRHPDGPIVRKHEPPPWVGCRLAQHSGFGFQAYGRYAGKMREEEPWRDECVYNRIHDQKPNLIVRVPTAAFYMAISWRGTSLQRPLSTRVIQTFFHNENNISK